MQPKTLEGPHKGRTILTDDNGAPMLVEIQTRESTSVPGRIKAMLVAKTEVPGELVDKFLEQVPEEDRGDARKMIAEHAGALVPMPFSTAQVPSDSMGYAVEFRLEQN